MAAKLAGIRGVHFNLVQGDGEGAFDGVSELWFDTQADFEAAYTSQHGQAVAADSMSRRERVFVLEHRVIAASFD